MPRQTLVKPAKVPLPPLNGEEVVFWLRILEDHAAFLRAGLLADSPALAEKAQGFYQELHVLRTRTDKSRKMTDVVDQALPVMRNFYQFQRQILNQMITCQLHSNLYPLQVDHLIRENGYAIRLFEKILVGPRTIVNTKAQENLFWVRIMEDHSQFMGALTDPSERNVIATARSFTREFDDLYLQGRDFVSLLDRRHQDAPAFMRYLEDTRRAVIRLRDFETMAEELINQCRLVGIFPQQLVDHLRREAEHYLMILAMFQKNMIDPEAITEEELLCETELGGFCQQAVVETADPLKSDETSCNSASGKWPHQYKKSSKLLLKDDLDNERDDLDSLPPQAEVQPVSEDVREEERETAPVSPPVKAVEPEEPEPKPPKFKWSGRWPRPLGKKGI